VRRVLVSSGWQDTPVIERRAFGRDTRLAGPLLIEEDHATHFIPADWEIAAVSTGDLVAVRRRGDTR
jgi:N-methylhydantoinase A/oxoprolinase/acetone carboxylase beta subunit